GGAGGRGGAPVLAPCVAGERRWGLGATPGGACRALAAGAPARAERLEPVPVEEPTVEETVAILRGNKARFENYHRLEITDEALFAVADLAARHLPEGILPDKVIDLVDEAAARFRRRESEDAVSLEEATRRPPAAVPSLPH